MIKIVAAMKDTAETITFTLTARAENNSIVTPPITKSMFSIVPKIGEDMVEEKKI